jgi:ABC-type transport system involved in multi-copper enzyme maturation permease subunit
MTGIFLLTLRELHSAKVIYVVLAVSAFFVWQLGFQTDAEYVNGVAQKVKMYGKDTAVIELYDTYAIYPFLFLFLLVPVIAGTVPRLMRRGRIEMLHAKPITRSQLLVSGLLTMIAVTAFVTLSLFAMVWFVSGTRTGAWHHVLLVAGLLWLVPCIATSGVTALWGVIAASSPLSMTLSWFTCLIIPAILDARSKLLYPLFQSETARWVIDRMYDLFPHIPGVSSKIAGLVVRYDFSIAPFVQSLAAGCIAVGTTLILFHKKSF